MRVKILLTPKDIRKMEALSADRGLLTFFNTEIDIKNHVRQLYFPDMTSKVAAHYYALGETNQYLIGRLVKKLAKERDHHGFNLTLYLHWLAETNGDGPKLNTSTIAKYIAEIERTSLTSGNIMSGISKIKQNDKIKEDQVQFEDLRNNLLFETSLIHNGAGYIELIKPEVIEEYIEHPVFNTKHRMTVAGQIGQQLKSVTVKMALEEFAEYTGRKWEELVDRKYCVINYTYSYAFLDESSRELVNEFIEVLHESDPGAKLRSRIYEKILDGTIMFEDVVTTTRDISEPLEEDE